MNISKRFLSMFLVLCMFIGLMPMTALAAGASSTAHDYQYNIVHVDAGRKYFSPANLKAIIDNAAAAGFNQVELYLSDNQGFRFALADMTITTSYGTYDLTDALGDGYSDDSKAPDGSGKYLTQSEMTDIIAYANTKGIDIVPCINVPGHMGAILEGFTSFRYTKSGATSKSSIDLDNPEAVAFALALTEKYAAYFASQGCKYYNVGADEYANDLSSMGFEGMGSTLYTKFVEFLNDAADIVIKLGMTPRAFNDGFYYKNYSINVEPNKAYEVCYWSSGWNGYNVAAASTIADKGHKMINTNGDYYWILGNGLDKCTASKASQFDETAFQGSTISDPAGSMFCIWCDVANTNGTDEGVAVVADTADVIAAFGGALPKVENLVGGSDSEEPTETVIPNAPATMTVGGSVTLSVGESAEWTSSNEEVITLTSVSRAVTSESVVANAVGAGTATITATGDSGTVYSSDITVTAETGAETAYDELVEITVGQTSETYTDNSGYYTTASGLNNAVATVKLGGNAGSEATIEYKSTTKAYSDLATNNTWTKTEFFHKVGDNYYPIYAYYKSSFISRTYYLGYSMTASSSDITAIGNTDSWNYKELTVYTQSGTEAEAAKTTVAFTGVSVGTTYATVGSTTYKVVVSKAAYSATVTINATKTYTDSSENVTVADSSVAAAVLSDGTLTITGKKVGTTTVTTDNAVYTITVTEIDLSTVDPLVVELWITNQPITDPNTGLTEISIAADSTGVFSETGVSFDSLLPDNISFGDRYREYWQTRLLDVLKENNSTTGTEFQTRGPGEDETASGYEITQVRYWNDTWQVLTPNGWVDVNLTIVTAVDMATDKTTTRVQRTQHQLVAYYMEIVDIQNENGTTELHVNAADWGKKGDGTPNTEWMDVNKYCSVSLQIVYEDGSTNPVDSTAANLSEKTIVYGYWDDGRGIGTLRFNGLDNFEIYRITAETGAVTATISSSSSPVYVTDFDWDENEKTVWEGDPTQVAFISNNANNPNSTDPYDNLMWNENREAILIRVYVKAVENEDSLTVVYYDEKFNDTLYTYNITVHDNVNFDNNLIGTPSTLENGRKDVTGCGIENVYGVTQYFQTDLTQVPEAVGKYNSELYEYTGSEISADGKTLTLYYNINTSVLSPNFVVDFGLPLQFNLSDIVPNVGVVDKVGLLSARYGTLTYNNGVFTYTPTKILQNIDVLSITLTIAGNTNTTNVGVTPATTVYYEESFVNWDSGWTTTEGTSNLTQAAEILGSKQNNFGYDPAYADNTGASNGTSISTSTIGANCTFTFTGTGIQVFANCTDETGRVAVTVKNSAGKIVSMSFVDTVVTPGSTGATTGQTGAMYGLPIVSLIDLTNMLHDQYTVTITKILDEDEPVSIDGIRVFGTIEDSTIFADDLEDNPSFYEMRDMVLNAFDTSNSIDEDREQVYKDIADALDGDVAIITGSIEKLYPATDPEKAPTLQDLLDNGPKNELFLYPGQTLTFKVSTKRVMQIGLKAPQAETKVIAKVDNKVVDILKNDGENGAAADVISSSVDMFYTLVGAPITTAKEYTVSITNDGSGLLSVTLLKICDDPNAAFVPLDAEDIAGILGVEVDEDIEDKEPEEDVKEEEPEEDEKVEIDFENDEWFWDMLNLVNSKFAIIAEAHEGGSISKEGVTYVKYYNRITYTITPDEGYEVESVIVDGEDVGAVRRYTFRQVKDDHTISVKFKAIDEAAE